MGYLLFFGSVLLVLSVILLIFFLVRALFRFIRTLILKLFGLSVSDVYLYGRRWSLLVHGLTCLVLYLVAQGALAVFYETDTGRFVKTLYYVNRGIGDEFRKFNAEYKNLMAAKKAGTAPWDAGDEEDYVKSEDPQRVRMLFNMMGEYEDRGKTVFRELIELKALPARIFPGEKVAFTLTPLPGAPKMSSEIMLSANPAGKTLFLKRRRDGTYRGSLKFKKTDSGIFRFFYEQLSLEDEVFGSNTATVVVAPKSSGLSRIYFQEARPHMPMIIHAGERTTPTLLAVATDGKTYNITGLGAHYVIEDERNAVVSGDEIAGLSAGKTTIRATYGTLTAEAGLLVMRPVSSLDLGYGMPDRKKRDEEERIAREKERAFPVNPPEDAVMFVGEKVILEGSPIDIPGGPGFLRSSWRIDRAHDGREVAYLYQGNSNTAEWVPRVAGTFQWSVAYSYNGPFSFPDRSEPRRIIVIEKQEESK